jgi:biopolymer transport protein ExbD
MPHIKKTMKHIIPIALLFLSFSSCGQTKNNEIESILLGCLTKSYEEQQVDINKELDLLEKYLIESKSLKSSSGQSYFDFYQEIVRLNDIPATLDYDRFDNIYKLTPNQFYSTDCLEELKRLDSTAIANSKYNQMTVAIQQAADDEVSPSNIAKAITSVLTPSDFDKPYYRAVALLTIAYTANTEIGLERQLITVDNEDFSSYEVMTITTTDKNQIILNGKTITQEELEKKLVEFIQTNKSNHQIQFQADKGTSYDFYLRVQETIKTVYNDLRVKLAKEKFNKSYNELNEDEQKEIREIYPFRLKE